MRAPSRKRAWLREKFLLRRAAPPAPASAVLALRPHAKTTRPDPRQAVVTGLFSAPDRGGF